MTTRYLVNDLMTCIPGTRTFWHDLVDWFGLNFVGGAYEKLAVEASRQIPKDATLVIRNATYFGPLETDAPTISLVQDIVEGEARKIQELVCSRSAVAVFNSRYTASKYGTASEAPVIIPLPIDFNHFEPGNYMGLQQKLGLPDGCVCWVGASQGAAGDVKGWPTFLQIVRMNPDIGFVAVLKDAMPDAMPPNLRCYERLAHDALVDVMGACRVGLCTSVTETQHLAGIEMGACGLPMVAPPIGCYYGRDSDLPGWPLMDKEITADRYAEAIRDCLSSLPDPAYVHDYWRKSFDQEIIRKQWAALIEEVER